MLTAAPPAWRHQAACRQDPELWFTGRVAHDTVAAHVCHHHCSVLRQCQADALARQPAHGVQGGMVWATGRYPYTAGRIGTRQPKPTRCGDRCRRFTV